MSAHPISSPSFQSERARIAPTVETERIRTIDILRGFALFGVLLINMRNFDFTGQVWQGTADRIALWLVLLFGDSKFWTIFSFLFGLGFSLQLERARVRGVRFVPFYARRLLVLLVFGMLHFLIYPGDILFDYSLTGFILLFVRGWSNRTIIILAVVCYMIPMAYYTFQVHKADLRQGDTQAARAYQQQQAQKRERDKQADRLLSTGSFPQVTGFYARHFAPRRFRVRRYFLYGELVGGTLPLFLVGLLVGRRRIFQNIRQYLPFLRKALWWTMPLGITCTAISLSGNWPDAQLPYETQLWRGLLWWIGTPALSSSYTCIVIVAAQNPAWQRRLYPLAALGRMALSNYLLQSVVFTTLYYGYGFRLYGRIGPGADILLTIVIYTLQLPLSMWWLRRFRFGPMEWLWRTLTYGTLQPMRVAMRAVSTSA